jgi:hypothetical protein
MSEKEFIRDINSCVIVIWAYISLFLRDNIAAGFVIIFAWKSKNNAKTLCEWHFAVDCIHGYKDFAHSGAKI